MLSGVLSEFVVSTEWATIAPESRRRAQALLLDCLGVALAGSAERSVCAAVRALDCLPDSAGEYAIWGHERRAGLVQAAMVNAMSAHALDFDDTHAQAIVHASAILTPLSLLLGQAEGRCGAEVLTAFVVGWEVAARVGIAAQNGFHRRGFHSTVIAGTFGAAACAAKLLGLDVAQTRSALGLAGSFAAGVNEFLADGSDAKVCHVAHAVQAGITVAALAKGGVTGPVGIFDGRDNIFRTHGVVELARPDLLTKDLGQGWAVDRVSLKPYPCCHFGHGLIDAALVLYERGFALDDVVEIRAFLDDIPINFIGEPLADKRAPKSVYAAKFSAPYMIARALCDGVVTLDNFQQVEEERVLALAQKVVIVPRRSEGFPSYYPGKVVVELEGGECYEHEVFINKGNSDNPLTRAELLAKFYHNCQGVLTENEAQDLVAVIETMGSVRNFVLPELGRGVV